MNTEIKQVKDVVSKREFENPFGKDIINFKLSEMPKLLNENYVVEDAKLVDGDKGEYFYLLLDAGYSNSYTPELCNEANTKKFSITTGSKAIVEKVKEIQEKNLFPVLGQFTVHRSNKGMVWYDLE